ncbi:MAG: type II secretion system protein [Kiritimatiellia bacterium]
MTARMGKQGFTLVELIVVIGMLMLLAGAVTSSVSGAHRRAKIQQATVEAQEMTKAILAYENYGKGFSLDAHVMEDQQATEQSLGFILGKENMQNQGQSGKMPVLFNASITRSGKILDPWGNPYYVTIKKDSVSQQDNNRMTFNSYVAFPNYNRRPADDLKERTK